MTNLKEQLKSLAKPKLVPVKFGDFDCFLRRWNEREHVEWAIECQTSETKTDVDGHSVDYWLRAKCVARSLCDATGALIFDDWKDVAEFDSDLLEPVYEAVIALQSRADDSKKD